MKSPALYVPSQPSDFIGDAAEIAAFLARAVTIAKSDDNAPIRLLLAGDPGIGKSALIRFLQSLLGADKFSTTKLNGTQVKIETVEEIAASLHYKSLFGDYRLIWIDEADAIPTVGQVRFLTLLDDLPHGTAVACTSNCKVKNFEERFQSRFQVFEMKPPQSHEIETLLARWPLPRQTIVQIANYACGNVRQALIDADASLKALPVAA